MKKKACEKKGSKQRERERGVKQSKSMLKNMKVLCTFLLYIKCCKNDFNPSQQGHAFL